MIDAKDQAILFNSLGQTLKKEIVCYAIGGTAMMLRGLKDQTLDVDLVFDKKEDRDEFINALKNINAIESSARIVYGERENTPKMLILDNVRFDLFLNKIITSYFSDKMKERAREIHEFGNKLKIRPADQNDILIMKSVTSREKDLNDIILIDKRGKINWEIILDACQEQVNLGNELAILSLGEKLETLRDSKNLDVPKNVLDSLFNMLKKQVKKKKKK